MKSCAEFELHRLTAQKPDHNVRGSDVRLDSTQSGMCGMRTAGRTGRPAAFWSSLINGHDISSDASGQGEGRSFRLAEDRRWPRPVVSIGRLRGKQSPADDWCFGCVRAADALLCGHTLAQGASVAPTEQAAIM
jgi:hypothetical protein